jgi:hypothetical protein
VSQGHPHASADTTRIQPEQISQAPLFDTAPDVPHHRPPGTQIPQPLPNETDIFRWLGSEGKLSHPTHPFGVLDRLLTHHRISPLCRTHRTAGFTATNVSVQRRSQQATSSVWKATPMQRKVENLRIFRAIFTLSQARPARSTGGHRSTRTTTKSYRNNSSDPDTLHILTTYSTRLDKGIVYGGFKPHRLPFTAPLAIPTSLGCRLSFDKALAEPTCGFGGDR